MSNTPELEVLVESGRLSKDSVIAYQAIVAQRQLQALLDDTYRKEARIVELEREIVDMQALLDKNKQLREVADHLADHLVGYVCHCNLSKCKCGHDYVIDVYEDMCGKIQPNKDAHHE